MAYVGQALVIGEDHFGDQLDAIGHRLSDLRADLSRPAKDLFDAGALFGNTPEESFYVDTGPAVNTPDTEAQGLELANVRLRTSSAGEGVIINVVKTPITQSI